MVGFFYSDKVILTSLPFVQHQQWLGAELKLRENEIEIGELF